MNKVVISDAAKHLCVTEESIKLLIKHHWVGIEVIDGVLTAKDEDIFYFEDYISRYGKLPSSCDIS